MLRALAAISVVLLSITALVSSPGCVPTDAPSSIQLQSNLIRGEIRLPVTLETEPVYTFGFDRRLEPKEDAQIYSGLLRYLERQTGYRFNLHVTPRTQTLVDEILAGQVDFAAAGTLTYLQVREVSDATMLVRGINHDGESSYQAIIVTRPDSSLQTLDDLVGQTFAFGARSSTQGYLIPRLMLSQAGIELTDLASYEFTQSHFETSNAVTSGRVEAGALQDTLAETLVDQGLLRIIARSDYYPSSGIVAGAHVPAAVVDAVRDALIAFDPEQPNGAALYHWERTEMPLGFSTTNDSDYDELHRWAEAYNLLSR